MEILVCPKCELRVVVGDDYKCPSCRASLNELSENPSQAFALDRHSSDSSEQLHELSDATPVAGNVASLAKSDSRSICDAHPRLVRGGVLPMMELNASEFNQKNSPEPWRIDRNASEVTEMNNPYESPPSSVGAVPVSPRSYGGLRRKICFFSIWPLGFLWEIAKRDGGMAGFILVFIVILLLMHYRAKNIGLSPWALCLVFIPLINLLFLAYCLIVPQGYADSKKLDGAAYLLIIPPLGMFVLLAIALATDLARLILTAN